MRRFLWLTLGWVTIIGGVIAARAVQRERDAWPGITTIAHIESTSSRLEDVMFYLGFALLGITILVGPPAIGAWLWSRARR